MNNINYYHPINVLTQRGFVELKNVVPGDYVFEYGTSKLLKVIEVPQPSRELIHKVTFNDGREQYLGNCDYLYTGKTIASILSISEDTEFGVIEQYAIDYHNDVYKPLDPDAYLAGALLMYGDYEDEFINIPSYMNGINEVFSNKHSVEYGMEYLNNQNKMYFKYIGDSSNTTITWKKFFNNKNIYPITKDKSLPLIPDEYAHGSLKDRLQFIYGAVDMGYSIKLFPDGTVGIVNKSEDKLKEFQKILWSVGIVSKISYDTNIDKVYKNNYKLEIYGNYQRYPGFTYLVSNIEHILEHDNEIISYIPQFFVSIKQISLMDYNGTENAHGYIGNLILEKPKALYITDDFLPRVSV